MYNLIATIIGSVLIWGIFYVFLAFGLDAFFADVELSDAASRRLNWLAIVVATFAVIWVWRRFFESMTMGWCLFCCAVLSAGYGFAVTRSS